MDDMGKINSVKEKEAEYKRPTSKEKTQKKKQVTKDTSEVILDINPEGQFQMKTKHMKNVQKEANKGKKEKEPKVAEAEIISDMKEFESKEQKKKVVLKKKQEEQEHQKSEKKEEPEQEKTETSEKEGQYTIFDYSSIKKSKRVQHDELSLESILNKCETESAKINTFLHTKEFRKVLCQQYKMIPSLVSKSMINEFIKELDSNESYVQYIQEWKSLNQVKKLHQMEQQGWIPKNKGAEINQHTTSSILQIPMKHLILVKPYIELFTDFMQRNCQEEIHKSKEIFSLADVSAPWDWFPQTREKYPKRTFHYHMGPTNSGKTKNALDHLRKAKSGCYLSPLRLLAMEVQQLLSESHKNEHGYTEDGVVCSVRTGPHKQNFSEATHLSCTIEMTDFEEEYECAVVDEIQMINDPFRGYNWTNAVLGLQAKEIHLCGHEAALKIVSELLQQTGDELIVHKYGRFSSLEADQKHIKNLDDIKTGDCFVSFSKKKIYELKNTINQHFHKELGEDQSEITNHCAVLYGSLPAESKLLQAQLFNERKNNIKFLIATDAIGLGMNLNINRVIFMSLRKAGNAGHFKQLTHPEVAQIAGRAGRYTRNGAVSSFDSQDLQYIRKGVDKFKKQVRLINGKESNVISSEKVDLEKLKFTKENSAISQACIFPPNEQLEVFSKKMYEQSSTFSMNDILKQFKQVASFQDNFFLRNNSEAYTIFGAIEHLEHLTLEERFTIGRVPIHVRRIPRGGPKNPNYVNVLGIFVELIEQYAKDRTPELLQAMLNEDINTEHIFNTVSLPPQFSMENEFLLRKDFTLQDIQELESMSHVCDCYLWLNSAFPQSFAEAEHCLAIKDRCHEIIDMVLLQPSI